eukprot:1157460-Pelagomonas_calceolata.AAC.3
MTSKSSSGLSQPRATEHKDTRYHDSTGIFFQHDVHAFRGIFFQHDNHDEALTTAAHQDL